MTKRDEVALVKRLKKGEQKAGSDLMAAYGGKIYNTAYSMLKSAEDAEDVLQETFFKVFQKIDTFREESSLLTWIYRIALNFCYLRLRRNPPHRFVAMEDYLPKFDGEGRHLAPVSNWGGKPQDNLLRQELLGLLKKGIEELPEKYSSVLVLKDIDGLSVEEIAGVTKLSISAVKSRLHRARLALRGMLAARYEGDATPQAESRAAFSLLPVLSLA